MIIFDEYIMLQDSTGESRPINFLDVVYFDYPSSEMYYCQFTNINYPPITLFIKDTYTKHITSEIAEKKLLQLFADDPASFFKKHIEEYTSTELKDTLSLYPDGPGTLLHNMLGKFGIKPGPACKCMAKANHMNLMGPDWCEKNIDLILYWLREESKSRDIPFIESLAKILVKRAISKSKKLQKK